MFFIADPTIIYAATPPPNEPHTDVFWLTILTSSNSAPPEDGVYTGTCTSFLMSISGPLLYLKLIIIIIIIIINIKEWTLWSVPSPQLQLLAPTLLRSSNCSTSLWSVVVWFQRDSVLWHSLQVWKPVFQCQFQYKEWFKKMDSTEQ